MGDEKAKRQMGMDADQPDFTPEPAPPPPSRPLRAEPVEKKAVQTIQKVGTDRLLVQWVEVDGQPRRAVLNRDRVSQIPGEASTVNVSAADLANADPHGLPWERLIELHASPESIAAELRRAGIWTLEDLRRNPGAALGAIQTAYHLDYQTLLGLASEHVKKE